MYRITTLLASIAMMLLAFTTISQAARVDEVLGTVGLDNGQTSLDNTSPQPGGPGITADFF